LDERSLCFRSGPTRFLDGRAIQCITLPGAAFCGNCATPSVVSSRSALPRRAEDLFNPPRIDLLSRLKPNRNGSLRSSGTSFSSNPSPKRRKVTHTSSSTMAEFESSSTALPSPAPYSPMESPTIAIASRRQAPPSVFPSLRRQPAGIEARQHQIAATERQTEFDAKVMEPIVQMLNFFRDKCVMCFMLQKEDWKGHDSDKCRGQLANTCNDKAYGPFRKCAMRLPTGWCFYCLLPQKDKRHAYVEKGGECVWRGILMRVLYMFTQVDARCPFLPSDIDVGNTASFRVWLSTNSGVYPTYPFYNHLKLILWLLYEVYNLQSYL